MPEQSSAAQAGDAQAAPMTDTQRAANAKAEQPQKKGPTGAEKKAAAKAEKAARRAAHKPEGPASEGSPLAVDGQSTKQIRKDQQQQHHQRRPSGSQKPAAQQLPTRTRRPSNTAASTTPAKPKSQKIKQLSFLSHLYFSRRRPTPAQLQHPSAHRDIHPSVQTLALHLESYRLCGSQARTIGLLLALKAVIRGYSTPQGTSLPRHLSSQGLSAQLNHVKSHGRPFCTAQSNAVRWLKNHIATLDPSLAETSAINNILNAIDEYIRERFTIADKVIAQAVAGHAEASANEQSRLSDDQPGLLEDDDEVLVYGKSAVVCASLREAAVQGKRYSVLCVDAGRPLWEGKKMAKSLATLKVSPEPEETPKPEQLRDRLEGQASVDKRTIGGITSITYISLSQLNAHLLQSPVTKAFLGANTIYSNGSVLSRAGQAQVALAIRTECPTARTYILAESVKCTERAVLGTSALAVAELAPENELVHVTTDPGQTPDAPSKGEEYGLGGKGQDAHQSTAIGQRLSGQENDNLYLMHLLHDVTPPELIDAIVTEVGTVPAGTAGAVGRMVGVGGELGEV